MEFRIHRSIDVIENLLIANKVSSLLDLGGGNNPLVRVVEKLNIRHLILDVGTNPSEVGHTKRINLNFMCFPEVDAEILNFYKSNTVDCVLSLQSIEHLSKEDGLILLNQVELWARKLIIFDTPNGYVQQGPVGGNPYQRHLSGWHASEFRSKGYCVKGSGGLKILKKNSDKGAYKFRFKGIHLLDSVLSRFLLRESPRFAFNLIAYKVLRN